MTAHPPPLIDKERILYFAKEVVRIDLNPDEAEYLIYAFVDDSTTEHAIIDLLRDLKLEKHVRAFKSILAFLDGSLSESEKIQRVRQIAAEALFVSQS